MLYSANNMESKDIVLEKLRGAGFRMTPQRLAIIEFLLDNETHPSADDIYQKIRKKYPMLSLSTVYNTLETLRKMGQIQALTISEDRIRYDPEENPHHHFFCKKCGKIIDICPQIKVKGDCLEKHRIHDYKAYFYGICSDCLHKKEE